MENRRIERFRMTKLINHKDEALPSYYSTSFYLFHRMQALYQNSISLGIEYEPDVGTFAIDTYANNNTGVQISLSCDWIAYLVYAI
jgi:hypothetical protein